MNFNFGEVLARAGQITWKNKNLWLAGIVITLVSFLSAPISLMVNPAFSSLSDPSEINRQMPSILLANGLVMCLSILSIPLYVIGLAIPSLGTFQLEKGSEKLRFGELVRGTLPYFWRILAIFLLIGLGAFLAIMILAVLIGFLSAITFGLAALCFFPLFILFIPLGILVYAFMEQAMAAILVDNLGVSSALQRAWELLKKNLLAMALMSLIIYLGSMVVSMLISVPMMIPMFGYMTNVIQSAGSEPDFQAFQSLYRNMMWWMLAFSPFYAVFEGILFTFMQSAWTLTYLRLTRSLGEPVLQEAAA